MKKVGWIKGKGQMGGIFLVRGIYAADARRSFWPIPRNKRDPGVLFVGCKWPRFCHAACVETCLPTEHIVVRPVAD